MVPVAKRAKGMEQLHGLPSEPRPEGGGKGSSNGGVWDIPKTGKEFSMTKAKSF